jgi:hypothetical protein
MEDYNSDFKIAKLNRFIYIRLLTVNEGQPGKSEDVKSWRGSSSVAFSSQPTRSQLLNPETQKESERRFGRVVYLQKMYNTHQHKYIIKK